MIFGESLNIQYYNFLFSVCFGMALSVSGNLYNVIVEVTGIKNTFLKICDTLFAVLISVLIFMFFLSVNYGIIRFYMIFGIVSGAWVLNISIAPFFFGALKRILFILKDFFKKPFVFICKKLKKLTKKT